MKRCIALLLALCLGLCACAAPAPVDTVLFAMDTEMSLRVYGDRDGRVSQQLQQQLLELDAELSATAGSGALYRLNTQLESDDPHLLALCQAAKALYDRTGGAVDPTVCPAVRLWGFTGESYRVPTQDELDQVLGQIGLDRVTLDADRITLAPDTQLDFGALAKGYAADLCRAILEEQGCAAILSLGGNIQTVGTKPDRSPWTIGIADPQSPERYQVTLSLEGSRAVVTSGDYQRYFEYEGVRYCHILDPKTASPVQGDLRSVTVVCDSGVEADGLATALFVLGLEDALALWRQAEDFEAVFIDREGNVTVTQGLAQAVSNCSFTVAAR